MAAPLWTAAALLLAAAVGLCLARERRRLRRLIASAETALGAHGRGTLLTRLTAAVDALVEHQASPRFAQVHGLSRLPTREPLFARMAEDGKGVLALLALKDYDRLCAFDQRTADRVLLVQVGRLRAMLPPTRFVAHVDRGHLAIWAGGEEQVGAELDALLYALGDRIVDGDREILPEVLLRSVAYDGQVAPAAALTRALSSFAAAPASGGELVDPEAIARDRFLLEQDLRQAVARGELTLEYQPLIDAGAGRVCGAEALIRWRHPTRGLMPPSLFVPVMESMGLSDEIGMWALNAAVREARGWAAAGLGPLRVAVNVSGHQLERCDLATMVGRTLQRHEAGAELLEIELTESVAMGDGDKAARLFEALHALGVTIAIDDFGTGYSSLSTLRTLAFDKIKIDREFVADVHTRRDSQAICQSVVALGRGLGIRVLAEGVEHRAEYQWLRRHGCRHFQGFYFSPPLAPAAFVDFARDRERLARLLALDPAAMRSEIKERLKA